MRLLPALIFLIQAAPPQSEVEKLEAALKKFGERHYKVIENGEASGSMTLATRIEKEGDRKVAVIEAGVRIMLKDFAVSMKVTEKASLNGLRLISSIRTGRDSAGDQDASISVREGKAFLKVKDRTPTIEITERTVGELAPLFLAGAADQKVGASIRVDIVTLLGERLDRGIELRCVTKESLELGGKRMDAFKWELWKVFETKEGTPSASNLNQTLWASPEGIPLRYTSFGGVEVVLDSK